MAPSAVVSVNFNRPASATELRLQAAHARATSELSGRAGVERRLDIFVADALDGLADNREYLDKRR